MSVQEVNDNTFSGEVLEANIPVLVDFWAPWCGPCRMVAPVVEAISEKLTNKLKTVKINTDENQKTAMDYQITGIPCLILFKNGKEATRLVGFKSQEDLESKLAQYL